MNGFSGLDIGFGDYFLKFSIFTNNFETKGCELNEFALLVALVQGLVRDFEDSCSRDISRDQRFGGKVFHLSEVVPSIMTKLIMTSFSPKIHYVIPVHQ